ncbi:hypothetical protein BJF83_03985 [Nocardiopsis sp. CNR-923]|nr:hypothetical protein BJF83_03985 [Nocardiopsis sp. CNR-923]
MSLSRSSNEEMTSTMLKVRTPKKSKITPPCLVTVVVAIPQAHGDARIHRRGPRTSGSTT